MRNLTIFALMGIFYVFIEVAFSSITSLQPCLIGRSSLWMMLVGGLLGLSLGKLNENAFMYRQSHLVCVLSGAALITLIELLSGIVLNIWLGFDIWDYSSSRFNFLGQIDYVHSICWVILTPFVFWADDAMQHYMFGEPKPAALWEYYMKNIKV